MAGVKLSAADLKSVQFVDDPPPRDAPVSLGKPVKLSAEDLKSVQYLDDKPPPAEQPGWAESLGRGALQGATLGFADEISGGLEHAFTGKPYDQARDESRANFEAARKANPKTYFAGELGGGVATSALPFLNVAKGATVAAMAGKAALAGGIAGLGSSEADLTKGDVSGATWDTVKGAALGGALGAAGGKVGKIIGGAPARTEKRAFDFILKSAPTDLRDRLAANPQELRTLASQGSELFGAALEKDGAAVRSILGKEASAAENNVSSVYSSPTIGKADPTHVVDALEAVQRKLESNPGTAAAAKRVAKTIEAVKERWVPEAPVAPAPEAALEGPALLKALADKAGPKAKDRIASRSKDVAEVVSEYKLTPALRQSPAVFKSTTEAATKDVGSRIGGIWSGAVAKAEEKSGAIPLKDISKAFNTVQESLADNPATRGQANQVFSTMEDVWAAWGGGEATEVPAAKVRQFLTSLQSEGFGGKFLDPTASQALQRKLSKTLGGVLDAHLDRIASAAPKKVAREIESLGTLNRHYSILKDLDKAATARATAYAMHVPEAAAALTPAAQKAESVAIGDVLALAKSLKGDAADAVQKVADNMVGDAGLADTLAGAQARHGLASNLLEAAQSLPSKEAPHSLPPFSVRGIYAATVDKAKRAGDITLANLVTRAKAGNQQAVEALARLYKAGQQTTAGNAGEVANAGFDATASSLMPSTAAY
jgi:hypothetical protein